jgi:hypothetical protein
MITTVVSRIMEDLTRVRQRCRRSNPSLSLGLVAGHKGDRVGKCRGQFDSSDRGILDFGEPAYERHT